MKRFSVLIATMLLTACGTLPSKEKAARIYERENRGRKVVSVEERIEGHDAMTNKAFFSVTYTQGNSTGHEKDALKYHRVAEGWVRSPP